MTRNLLHSSRYAGHMFEERGRQPEYAELSRMRAAGVVRLVGEAVTHLRTPRSDTWERTRLRITRQPDRSAGLPARPLLRGRGRGDRIRVEDLGEVPPGVALRHRRDQLRRALGDDRATPEPALRPHVDQPVGALDHVEVVLDDDDRVALVHQALEDEQQLADVLEVQAGGRLVEGEDRPPGGPLLQLAGQLDPRRLTTGEGRGGRAEPDVPEPDVGERAQVPGD